MSGRTATEQAAWHGANEQFLGLALQRLRALLARRVLWLKQQWQHDPLEEARRGVIGEPHVAWLLRAEDVAAEQQFYQEDPLAREQTARAEHLYQEMNRLRQELGSQNSLPLDVLGHLFNLSDFERDVLLLGCAAELDPAFQPLFGYVQDNVQRTAPTMHLAFALFRRPGAPAFLLERAFSVEAPLRHYQLLTLADERQPLNLQPLRVPERILDYVRGHNHPDPLLQQRMTPVPAALLSGTLQEAAKELVRVVQSVRAGGAFPVVNLVGGLDGGQREVAATVANALRINLFELDGTQLAEQAGESGELLALLEREALLLQGAYYLDLTRLDPLPPAPKQLIHLAVHQANLLLFLGSRDRLEGAARLVNAPLPALGSGDRLALWQKALGAEATTIDLRQLVQQFRFGPQGVQQTVTAARYDLLMQGNGQQTGQTLTMELLWDACRRQSQWQLDDLAQRLEPAYTWDDLVLPYAIEQQLHEISDQVRYRFLVYETWGYDQKLSRGRGISALFAGASGTGKTMTAEVLANELKLPLYRIDLAGVVSKYVGETEKNLRRIFQVAEQSGAILFFDEADALFGKRTDVKDSHDRYANIEVNYLLQLMEGYSGLAILATNRRQAIDRAFLRRLRFVVDFVFPNADHRRRIWRKVFPPDVPLGQIDYNRLAQLEIAGGNIHSIALNAAFAAAADGGVVQMKHITAAARREYAKMDKMETAGTLETL